MNVSQIITTTESEVAALVSEEHNRFTALFRDHPGEPVPEENFWTLWCKRRLTEADTLTIQLGATPSGLTGAYIHVLYTRVLCIVNMII